MTKPELLEEINRVKDQIWKKKSELSEEEKNFVALEEFSKQCTSRINAFESSMSRRKKKLFDLDGMLNTVKMAARYKQKMTDMLTGKEYQNTRHNIGYMIVDKYLGKVNWKVKCEALLYNTNIQNLNLYIDSKF